MRLLFKSQPRSGDVRQRRAFAWLPVEYRHGDGKPAALWLEFYTREEQFREAYSLTGFDYSPRGWHLLRAIPITK